MDDTKLHRGATYGVTPGDLAILREEYLRPNGEAWVKLEVTRDRVDVIEHYPRAKFLEMIIQDSGVQTYTERG